MPTVCKKADAHGHKIGKETYCLETRGPLFVMARPKEALREKFGATDQGWIYATIVDGAVTSSGRVESCMGCHLKAPQGRLFGLPKTSAETPY